MAHLESLRDENDPLWNELLFAFEVVMLDVADEAWEKNGVQAIANLLDLHGYATLYTLLKSHIKGSCMDFLYWFARAGAKESIENIVEYLDSSDQDEVVGAAVSLAILNDMRGLETIEQLCNGTHPVKLTMHPSWYFLEDIKHINHPRVQEIQAKYLY